MHAAHMQYGKEMSDKKVMVGGSQLAPTTSANTLRLAGGKPVATDGPSRKPRNSSAVIT